MDSFLRYLRRLSQTALPGIEAHCQMMPRPVSSSLQMPSRWHIPSSAQRGSIAILLHGKEEEPETLLTLRSAHLAHHPNQWSYPGGRNEQGESLLETALRETQEELFLSPASLVFLNTLTPLYIPVSNFVVFPHVFWVNVSLGKIQYNKEEVADILSLPLTYFLDISPRKVEEQELRGVHYLIPHWRLPKPPILWGATAMILNELLALYEVWRNGAKE